MPLFIFLIINNKKSKMKKITKTNLQGLRQLFPVLGKEEMRCHVGGNSDGYYGDDWLNHGFGGYDPDGNYTWHSGYTKDEFDNWEGPWYGGWVYGLGYVYPDVNIYGYQGGAGSGYYGFGYYGSGYDGSNYYYNGYYGNSDEYGKIDFAQDSGQIGQSVIDAMRQYFVNDISDMRELVDFDSTKWGQGYGAIRSDYFYYNGKEVQWTVVNGTAAADNYRDVYSLATSNLVQNPEYNNYEIQIKFSDHSTALRLQTRDYETYIALLNAVGYP